MIYGVIVNGIVENIIEIDESEYTLEQTQEIFGMGGLLLPIPDGYAIGDMYDAEFQKWSRQPVPEPEQAEEIEEMRLIRELAEAEQQLLAILDRERIDAALGIIGVQAVSAGLTEKDLLIQSIKALRLKLSEEKQGG